GAAPPVPGERRLGRRDRGGRRRVVRQDGGGRPRVHRPRAGPPLAGVRRPEELRDRAGDRRLDPLARRRRAGDAGAPAGDPAGAAGGRPRGRVLRPAAQHLLGAVDPARAALPGLAAPALPARPRPVRRPRGARVRARGGPGGPARGAAAARELPRPLRLPGALRPLRHARRRRPAAPRRPGRAGRPLAPPPGALPVDVRPPPGLSRRLARLRAGVPLRALRLRALGQGVGEDEGMTGKERVLSGMRPTGKLHLGNYLGALDNWVRMQAGYDCFYFVANWHALTTGAEHAAEIPGNTVEMAADWLGAGLDPERSTLFIQSLVPEHAELHLLFSMVTPLGWLERVPTYTEMVEQLGLESPSYGLLGYPLSQAACLRMFKPPWLPATPAADREWAATGCRTAGIGCLDCKGRLLEYMLPRLAPIRERRQQVADKPKELVEILREGSRRAREVAKRTMDDVRRVAPIEP